MIALEAFNLRKTYRINNQIVEAVKNVSLNIASGQVMAFLGPNGAGKTTSIKMMAGLIKPDFGWTKISGINPHKNPSALEKLGAVLEGNRNVYWRLTPQENLEYFGVLKGLTHFQARKSGIALLERFGLQNKRRTAVQQLSRGMQQKLAFAVALVHQPQVLLLDEPTLGLDVEATEDVKILVREIAASGCAILLTTHQLDIAEQLADNIAIIQKGEIITELPTDELIRKFSGKAYKIQMESVLDEVRITELEKIGVEVEEKRIIYVSQPEFIYKVFDIIKPLELKIVEKAEADLTQIFLKLVKEGNRKQETEKFMINN
ncbi:ABC transporter ATP-binding protein [Calothrix sp. CCY 0018]|uniref:ABC transporter ATP-binding protein n=1 Tax=Calothrix sp. CCY 0018 TaxID=3103864 RepID=UPI0039C6451A